VRVGDGPIPIVVPLDEGDPGDAAGVPPRPWASRKFVKEMDIGQDPLERRDDSVFTKLAAEPSPGGDLLLCVPASQQVCPYSADCIGVIDRSRAF
jgi:hypothetical protein